MDNCKIQITNKNLIEPKHKNEHEPYEYYKYEVTKGNKNSQCSIAIYEIPPQKARKRDDQGKTIFENQMKFDFRIKFRSSLFKGLRFPKAEPLGALRRERNALSFPKRRSG